MRRLIVIGRHDKAGIGAGLLGVAGEFNRLGCAVAAGAGNHGHAPGSRFHAKLHHAHMFCMGKRRAFAGGANGDQAFRALGNLPLHQFLEGFFVHGPIRAHGRNQRNHGTLEHAGILLELGKRKLGARLARDKARK